MKKVLITGKNSYIGNSLEKWLLKEPDKYQVDKISLRDNAWKEKDFISYDSIVHVAGIAHIKETKQNRHKYFEINRDLTEEVAIKAKEEGLNHFIFLSSMSVYGLDEGVIDEKTPLKPKTAYGKSKLEAENILRDLEDEIFKVAILRPPMVYGPNCKGNYARLSKLAKITPIFPDVDNQRSMVFIDHLTEFVKLILSNEYKGLFFPQNIEYVKTTDMVHKISTVNNQKLFTTNLFNILIFAFNSEIIKKVFGTLIIDKKIIYFNNNYNLSDFEETINKTEKDV